MVSYRLNTAVVPFPNHLHFASQSSQQKMWKCEVYYGPVMLVSTLYGAESQLWLTRR